MNDDLKDQNDLDLEESAELEEDLKDLDDLRGIYRRYAELSCLQECGDLQHGSQTHNCETEAQLQVLQSSRTKATSPCPRKAVGPGMQECIHDRD